MKRLITLAIVAIAAISLSNPISAEQPDLFALRGEADSLRSCMDYPKAVDICLQIYDITGEESDLLYAIQTAVSARDYDRAFALAKKIKSSDPEIMSELNYQLAKASVNNSDWKKALTYFKKLLPANRSAIDILWFQDVPDQFYASMRDMLKPAGSAAEDIAMAEFDRGYLAEMVMRYDDALDSYNKALNMYMNMEAPLDTTMISGIYMSIANVHAAKQQYREIEEVTRKAIEFNPQYLTPYQQRAFMYRDLGRPADALDVVDMIPEGNDDLANYLTALILLYNDLPYLAISPLAELYHSPYCYLVSNIAHTAHLYALALRSNDYDNEANGVLLDNLNDYNLINQAEIYADLGRNDDAKAVIERMLKYHPHIYNYHIAAKILGNIGELDAAIDCLEKAYNLGWTNIWQDERDPDMEALRADPRYQKLSQAKLDTLNPTYPD